MSYHELQVVTFTYSLKGSDREALVYVLSAVNSSVKLLPLHLVCRTLLRTYTPGWLFRLDLH